MSKILNLIFANLLAFSLLAQTDSLAQSPKPKEETVEIRVEQSPLFEGCAVESTADLQKKCSDEKLAKFIADNLKYPEDAVKNQVQGTVIVGFTVQKDGTISDSKVIRDIGAGCGQAALDLIAQMPNWTPAAQGSRKVAVQMKLPIRFAFKSEANSAEQALNIHWGNLRGDKITKAQLLENIEQTFYVRDAFGNSLQINELEINLEKKRKSKKVIISGNKLTAKAKKLLKKAGSGSEVVISASVNVDGKLTVAQKLFQVE